MTPDEVALLKHAGQVFVQYFSAMVGIFLFDSMDSELKLRCDRKHRKTRATWILCTMLAILFSITTTYFCLYVAAGFKLMIGALIDNTDLELSDKFEVADTSIDPLNLAQTWISGSGYGLIFVFGDGIVVWRAWAVWSDQRSVIILPALTLLATFVCVIQTIGSTVSSFSSGTIEALADAAAALSIATNLIAVLLIGFKAYLIWFSQHWKFMRDMLGVGNSATGKVLMFLTESGIVYVICQIINFSLFVVDHTEGTSLDVATNIWTEIMIIFSLTEGSTAGNRNLGTRISFARPPPQQGTTVTDSIMIRSQADNGFQAGVARPTEEVLEV
ncbi:hypothetical protein C8J56DRAFT_1086042 [Mycena floridula]|nr:hypothetical protein C8J56DRAFT_1086042 [Mycena floridula]